MLDLLMGYDGNASRAVEQLSRSGGKHTRSGNWSGIDSMWMRIVSVCVRLTMSVIGEGEIHALSLRRLLVMCDGRVL